MRKRGKRIHQVARSTPPMVMIEACPEVGIRQRMAINALAGGWAKSQHFNELADVADHILVGAADRDEGAYQVADAARIALMNISDRYRATGKVGATGEELKMLRALIDVSDDFWSRQSGMFFLETEKAMRRFREIQNECGRETA